MSTTGLNFKTDFGKGEKAELFNASEITLID